jgi:hypothetical protein
MQGLFTVSNIWLGETEPNFYDAIFSNLAQEYKQLHQAIIHTTTVDPNEMHYLQERIAGSLPVFYKSKAQADLALLLYRQGRRSEARQALRTIAITLPNNSLEAIALKVRAALILAAAGDFKSACDIVYNLYNATKGFPIQFQLEIEVLPFFERFSRKSVKR